MSRPKEELLNLEGNPRLTGQSTTNSRSSCIKRKTHYHNPKAMEPMEEGKSEKSFKKKVNQFLSELQEAGGKLQSEFEEKSEELKVTAEKLKKEAENSERWKEVENNLKKAAGELGGAFKAAFKKRKP